MKILFLIKNSGVEKTTGFLEVIRELSERGVDIHIVFASQPKSYIQERYYSGAINVRVDVLEIINGRENIVSSLKKYIRKNRTVEKIIWLVFSSVMRCGFWIKKRINRHNNEFIFREFLSPATLGFVPQEEYNYVWTIDEYGLLWAEWINQHSEIKYKLVHHSLELFWEHFSLPSHKYGKYFKEYELFEKARTVLYKNDIIIIQDEARWNVLCQYTGIDHRREKSLLPVSIGDYTVGNSGSMFQELNIERDKKILFYPTCIMPTRGCVELLKMSKQLDDRFTTVIHGFVAIQSYLEKLEKITPLSTNVIISNTTLDYQELLNMHQDVWCVFLYYGEEDNNNKYIVNASNKLVMALQAGKPIIAVGNQMLAGLCVEYGCGIAISGWVEKEFVNAVYALEQNYDFYCKNARRCYAERYNIKPYADKIYDRLLAGI